MFIYRLVIDKFRQFPYVNNFEGNLEIAVLCMAHNLGIAKRNNWIFGGVSVFLLTLLIVTN